MVEFVIAVNISLTLIIIHYFNVSIIRYLNNICQLICINNNITNIIDSLSKRKAVF